jgi:hypothetical protein
MPKESSANNHATATAAEVDLTLQQLRRTLKAKQDFLEMQRQNIKKNLNDNPYLSNVAKKYQNTHLHKKSIYNDKKQALENILKHLQELAVTCDVERDVQETLYELRHLKV